MSSGVYGLTGGRLSLLSSSPSEDLTMILFRIEHKISHLGPFTNIIGKNYNLGGCDCPCPDEIKFSKDHKFAVKKLESIFEYFGPALNSLHLAGFQIIKISIENQFVVEGNGQCAYLWLRGRIIQSYSIPDARKLLSALDFVIEGD